MGKKASPSRIKFKALRAAKRAKDPAVMARRLAWQRKNKDTQNAE